MKENRKNTIQQVIPVPVKPVVPAQMLLKCRGIREHRILALACTGITHDRVREHTETLTHAHTWNGTHMECERAHLFIA